jgi:exopolysaccharide/PEP-CTERM locus tyrosine autokinase
MTEQSKIPMPQDSKKETLLERASGAFGLDGFAPAPVPTGLAQSPVRGKRVQKKADAEQPAEQKPAQKAVEPVQTAEAVEPAAKTAEAPVEPVRFNGTQGSVDRIRLADNGMIVPGGPVTALLEEFRIVKRQILQSAREKGAGKGQRVLICSPLPGEGKTFCATNLALAIAAEKDSEVLLVDADFAKPSILSTLGLKGSGKGLMDALANPEIDVADHVIRTDISGLLVLPAGNRTNSDSEFVASSRTPAILDRLTQGAPNRIVIFDSPPALAASPAAELAKHVGQAVLVARADQTGQSALEDALTLLGNCPDIRLLLNDARFSPSGRRFGSYYGYGA